MPTLSEPKNTQSVSGPNPRRPMIISLNLLRRQADQIRRIIDHNILGTGGKLNSAEKEYDNVASPI